MSYTVFHRSPKNCILALPMHWTISVDKLIWIKLKISLSLECHLRKTKRSQFSKLLASLITILASLVCLIPLLNILHKRLRLHLSLECVASSKMHCFYIISSPLDTPAVVLWSHLTGRNSTTLERLRELTDARGMEETRQILYSERRLSLYALFIYV